MVKFNFVFCIFVRSLFRSNILCYPVYYVIYVKFQHIVISCCYGGHVRVCMCVYMCVCVHAVHTGA